MDKEYGMPKKILDRYSQWIRSPKRPLHSEYFGRVTSPESGNQLISLKLKENKPSLIGRIGSTELKTIMNYFEIVEFRKANFFQKATHIANGRKYYWSNDTAYMIHVNSGVFPNDDQSLYAFSDLYLKCIQDLDVLGIWYNHGENLVHKKQCSTADLIPLTSLEPYYYKNPWSSNLKDKKVLVIHPFEQSITQQLKKHAAIFKDKKVLPKAEYSTIRAIQSLGYSSGKFKDWFEALEYMQNEIEKRDFDIAIIGAGAYGLPLGSFVKRLGKQAIHLGGATQILFGIKGKRWDNHETISKLYNHHWKYPEQHEKPKKAEDVEGGCYW